MQNCFGINCLEEDTFPEMLKIMTSRDSDEKIANREKNKTYVSKTFESENSRHRRRMLVTL